MKEEDRLAWVRENGGSVMEYIGAHDPTYAVINFREGTSIYSDQAMAGGVGIFNFDAWAVREYVDRINASGSGVYIDPDAVVEHMVNVFTATVGALSPIRMFHKLE